MTDWQIEAGKYFFNSNKRLPITLVEGRGTIVIDDTGKQYLDFFGGPAVTSLGHSHPVVTQAIAEQAGKLLYYSNAVYTVPQVQLAKLLIENSCLDRVYFCNSGAEAVEGAIKLARKYGKEKKDGAFEIICADNAFHGRTITTVTAGGTARYKEPFGPLPPGFVHVPFNDIDAIKEATTHDTLAVLLEPVQGEGGVWPADEPYMKSVRDWCDENGLLLILDEVQTGIGRCGALFAYELYGIEPDIMTLAKGLGSGVPVGAFLAKEHVNVFTPGDHGSTYGGNPLCTNVAYNVVKYALENNLSAEVARKGEYLTQRLRGLQDRYPIITDVRGTGLLQAIQFDSDIAEAVNVACVERGLIANNVRPNALRLAPPLTVSEEELDQAIDIIETVIKEL
jgi:acetylornithine/N-succinyldiaminopimelate aminotransferase